MRSNPLKLILLAQIAIATICGLPVLAGPQLTPADYVDPTIGNLAAFLRPTYPTVHQPNQMLRPTPSRPFSSRVLALATKEFSPGFYLDAEWVRPISLRLSTQG